MIATVGMAAASVSFATPGMHAPLEQADAAHHDQQGPTRRKP